MNAAADALTVPFLAFRFAWVVVGLGALALLWRRPRVRAGLLLVVGLNLAAWAAYVAPLGRLYALDELFDMAFNVGIAACAAAGQSVFTHVQVGFSGLEPVWTLFVASVSLFRPENVIRVYPWFAPLSIVVVGLGLFVALGTAGDAEDEWERLLMVFAVFGLGSFSLSQQTPVPPLWTASFLLKPNHTMAWAVVAVAVGLHARGRSPLRLGLVLGFLAWLFILHWAYLLLGLGLSLLFEARSERSAAAKRLVTAAALSGLVALPYVARLLGDYGPTAEGHVSKSLWADSLGRRLAAPHWATLDLGLLFVLGALGAWVWWRRRGPRDRVLLGLLAAVWLLWAAYGVGALVSFAPEPDELHHFLRFVMALAAGAALAAAARAFDASGEHGLGRGPVLALAACLPLSFPAYWDPPNMDRYYRFSLPPIGHRVLEYGAWIRDNTPAGAVFATGPIACTWIPVLAGRRVLLVGRARPPADYAERKAVERVLLTSTDSDAIRRAARRFGVTHVAIDPALLEEYGKEAIAGRGRLPAYRSVYRSGILQVLEIVGVESEPRPGP